jgi:hypothetical protein
MRCHRTDAISNIEAAARIARDGKRVRKRLSAGKGQKKPLTPYVASIEAKLASVEEELNGPPIADGLVAHDIIRLLADEKAVSMGEIARSFGSNMEVIEPFVDALASRGVVSVEIRSDKKHAIKFVRRTA